MGIGCEEDGDLMGIRRWELYANEIELKWKLNRNKMGLIRVQNEIYNYHFVPVLLLSCSIRLYL